MVNNKIRINNMIEEKINVNISGGLDFQLPKWLK